MPRVFINYRREDSRDFTGRLDDTLSEHFLRENVFRDVHTIWPGVDWVDAIQKGIQSCDVLLVVIGRQWLAMLQSRADRPEEDQVRAEIEGALQANKLVIPVLPQGSVMPEARELPGVLAKLTRRNAVEITDGHWDYDATKLIEAIERMTGAKGATQPPPIPPPDPPPEVPQDPLASATLMTFIGRWQMEDSAMTVSQLDFHPNGACQGLVSNPMYGFNMPFVGRWSYIQMSRTLQIQGLVNGIQPVNSVLLLQAAMPNGFQGTTMDGFTCRMTRLA